MPELGKYAVEVLSAYGVSIVLLLGVTIWSWAQYRAAKRGLQQIEGVRKDG